MDMSIIADWFTIAFLLWFGLKHFIPALKKMALSKHESSNCACRRSIHGIQHINNRLTQNHKSLISNIGHQAFIS